MHVSRALVDAAQAVVRACGGNENAFARFQPETFGCDGDATAQGNPMFVVKITVLQVLLADRCGLRVCRHNDGLR